ncbi:PDZ domain-containing protein [Herbidospora galbida]|uniref:PDZ domain-containing protein n=1 Tax=Herbidospora galbida TaxID=2575442 RepID=A0A4U3LRR4_9ACTN|nr:trypsin-like peptidase domain-containing protein [Herbidospora galbida]TKK78648.1 PDZ domain-containing protein [Herbidospora galbida]
MSADEREHEKGTTEVLEGRGWSQFGRRAPQYGDYRGEQPTPQFAPPPPPHQPGPIQGRVGANPVGDTAVYGMPPLPPEPPRQQRSEGRAWKRGVSILALACVAVGGGVAGALITNAMDDDGVPVLTSPVVNQQNNGSAAMPARGTIAAVAKAVQPSVVMITVTSQQGQGEGSGVILSADGLILTNNHVVAGAGQNAEMAVKFSDGRTIPATLVGTDPTTDIAVIRATGVSGLTAASLGDSDALQVGDSVLAIGSPLGLEGSVTSGIVSALDRTVTSGGGGGGGGPQLPPGWGGGFGQEQEQQAEPTTTIGGMVQTDAAINPGNSGGALVNSAGQVIGINTAIATSGGGNGNIGVGFAIPINTARNVADQLIKTGKAVHAYLGVSVGDATGDTPGALVSSVEANSPAAKAGLQQGDIITKVDGTAIDAGETVVGIIRGHQPGTKVTVNYVRNGQANTATITLEEKTTS